MRSANRRLERAEQQLAQLPMSPAEREALLDRLELRYTALLDLRLSIAHQVATEAGKETGPYEPPVPTEKDIEELRAHRRRWDLPRASERHPDEAWALVRSETLDVALAEGQRWGGSWAIWTEDEYVPTMRAYFEQDWKELGELVWEKVARDLGIHTPKYPERWTREGA